MSPHRDPFASDLRCEHWKQTHQPLSAVHEVFPCLRLDEGRAPQSVFRDYQFQKVVDLPDLQHPTHQTLPAVDHPLVVPL